MVVKDYYVVLGVPRTESLSGIRTAYRALAKRFHPDLAGDGGTRLFQEIVEAYDVLSDPERRLAHDRDLDDARLSRSPSTAGVPVRVDSSTSQHSWYQSTFVEPRVPRVSRVEPLRPRQAWTGRRRRSVFWIVR